MPTRSHDLGPLFTISDAELARPCRRREDRDVLVLRIEIEAQRREVARLRSILAAGDNATAPAGLAAVPTKMLLSLKDLRAIIGVSRGTLYRWVSEGLFPKQIHLGSGRMARWNRAEVEGWLATQCVPMASRRSSRCTGESQS
jgi:prophage regulatory protein